MAKPELGGKRQCLSCGAKFFDMNRDPILCPKCGAVFQITAGARAASARASAAAAAADDEPEEFERDDAELVSLEEADETSDKVVTTEEDIEIEDDSADEDDTFLEEDAEDSDDVSDLIDGDLDVDEES